MTGPFNVVEYCKKNNIKLVIDIQDLWPEAFEMIVNVPVLSPLIFYPFRSMANRIYSAADVVCGVSETYVKRALSVNSKSKVNIPVFLGTNLDEFDKNASRSIPLPIAKDNIWIAYCGTLGSSYDLKCVMDALHILKKKYKLSAKFMIMGDGPKRQEFESYAKQLKLDCYFTGYIPYEKMCSLLVKCDIAVNPINHGAAQSIINKHGDYTSAGLPIVSTQESMEFRALVKQYKMGFNCKNGDASDLADKFRILIQNHHLREQMGKNARKCAEERFDRNKTYNQIKNMIVE